MSRRADGYVGTEWSKIKVLWHCFDTVASISGVLWCSTVFMHDGGVLSFNDSK